MRYKILVVWKDGTEEYLKQGDQDAIFLSKRIAEEQKEFMEFGIDDAQSINVVKEVDNATFRQRK
jgi:hypothetical protein